MDRTHVADLGFANGPGGKQYKVTLVREGKKLCVNIAQPIGDEYHGCGYWYLSTLLGADRYASNGGMCDKLYIDFGQDWYVTGMKPCLVAAGDHF